MTLFCDLALDGWPRLEFDREFPYRLKVMKPSTLAHLKPGQRATIRGCEGDEACHLRLQELGLVEGSEVEFIRKAPLGDPLEIRILGYHLTLRQAEALQIMVEPAVP